MIIEYWGGKAPASALTWVNPTYSDPQVCHAARSTYDAAYKGCGNWPFNAAYAATYPDLAGVVTRLTSLTDLETLVRAASPPSPPSPSAPRNSRARATAPPAT